MKKNIWIMNHYAGGMFFEHGGRHYNFAKYLKRQDYDPVVFCCNSKHNSQAERYFDEESLWHEHMAEEIGTPFVFVKARTYVGNGKQRIMNMIDFYRNVKKVAKEYAKLHGKPDVIYASSVHPLTLVAGIQLAKQFGVKCVCEIRDLWPESLVAYGIAGPHNPAVLFLRRLEKWIYKKADALIFTMEGGYDYIIEQGWEKDVPRSKVHYINNGVDLEVFDYNREHYTINDPDLEDPDTFKVVYTGSIRQANNMGRLLDAAKEVVNPRVKFLVWGDGDELPMLKQRVMEEDIVNVTFKGSVEKKYVPFILSKANVCITDICSDALFRFGISPNKLFDYIASGKYVISCLPCQYDIVEKYRVGRTIDGEYPNYIVQTVQDVAAEKCVYSITNLEAARDVFDFKNLTNQLIEVLENA